MDARQLANVLELLRDVQRVIWIVPYIPPSAGREDSQANAAAAAAALVAGMALAGGRELHVLRRAEVRVHANVGASSHNPWSSPQELTDSLTKLHRSLEGDGGQPPSPQALLDTYRAFLRKWNDRPLPFSSAAAQDRTYKEIFGHPTVERNDGSHQLAHGTDGPAHKEWLQLLRRLAAVLALPVQDTVSGHWLVLGEPGSGKSGLRTVLEDRAARYEEMGSLWEAGDRETAGTMKQEENQAFNIELGRLLNEEQIERFRDVSRYRGDK